MKSTMQDVPLSVAHLFGHGRRVHRHSKVLTFDGTGVRTRTFEEVGDRAERLALALARLGISEGDRVGTFMWNSDEHLEAYFAVPCMGAVLHTLNLRLFPDQLIHIVNEAEDRVILAHATVLPQLAKVAGELKTLEHVIVVDDGAALDPDVAGSFASILHYEELLVVELPSGEVGGFRWPEIDERSAASMCYTSGTTGDPKGVVYSHRSTFLHAFGTNNSGLTFTQRDAILVVVPMFHVNAWGFPYSGWMLGADLVMPGRFLQGEPLVRLIELAKVTISAGVPTIWQQVLTYLDDHPGTDMSSVRLLVSGGAALPKVMIERFDAFGIRVEQGWGMTETSPLCSISEPPKEADPLDIGWRAKTGRLVPGVDLRIMPSEGGEAPWDGKTVGEIEVRGPWITGSYFKVEDPDKFHDGWLRTGDVGTIDDHGFIQISDRVKDVIKSGGEWISSVDLENEIMSHPAVAEAMVVGVPDDKWGERPLAVVVRRPQAEVEPEELRRWLEDRVAKWWVPERWAFVAELPKTSVGKFDKKVIRTQRAAGELQVSGE